MIDIRNMPGRKVMYWSMRIILLTIFGIVIVASMMCILNSEPVYKVLGVVTLILSIKDFRGTWNEKYIE